MRRRETRLPLASPTQAEYDYSMAAGGSNKPIVFVFGAQKDDADGRKRNLSAINTAVAYRAHEQRRAKKSNLQARSTTEDKVGSI